MGFGRNVKNNILGRICAIGIEVGGEGGSILGKSMLFDRENWEMPNNDSVDFESE